MKIFLAITSLFLVLFKSDNSEEVLHKMYQQYAGKWMHSFTFDQTTEIYRNDSLIRTAEWHEAIVYPDKFRIDFGDAKDGNAAIFSKDSVYSFHSGKLMRTTANDDDLTFILGGMYFYSFDTMKAMFTKMGYDLNKFCETVLDGKPAYVIGANDTAEKATQLWIDKEKLVAVKFINYNHGEKEEGIFSNHKQFDGGWSETNCIFYVNGKLIQKENYFNCKTNGPIDPKIFDPKNFAFRN
jgi:hypothetical protein